MSVTAVEQEMVYLVNLARHDPTAYAVEQSLGVDLSYVTPRGPLSVNDALYGSSGFHAEEMAAYNYFGHTSAVTGDQPNKMARDHGYELPYWFSDQANNIESLAAGYPTATSALNALIVDEGINPPGHRNHLLGIGEFYAQSREVGVGYAYSASALYRHYWAIHATFHDPAERFVTGVIYDDLDGDQRYDAGEGLSGVTVVAGPQSTTTNAAGGWSLEVAPGQYSVAASGGSFGATAFAEVSVGDDNVEVDFISGSAWGIVDFGEPIDGTALGTVDQSVLDGQDPTGGDLWFWAEAAHDGFFTVEAVPTGPADSITVSLYGLAGNETVTSSTTGDGQRLDYEAVAGERVFVKLSGTDAQTRLRLTNLVSHAGTHVTVHGTAGEDVFELDASGGLLAVINDAEYLLDAAQVDSVAFDGGDGADTVRLFGSAGDDTLRAWPHTATWTTGDFSLEAGQFEALEAHSGGGTLDTAFLFDSPAPDYFSADPTEAVMSNPDYELRAVGFPYAHGYATAGGHDTADFRDSPGDDTFIYHQKTAKLIGETSFYYRRAKYFEETTVTAENGADAIGDIAYLLDSPSYDEFTGTPGTSTIELNVRTTPAGRQVDMAVSAVDFDYVHAYSKYGSDDAAYLFDSPGDDTLIAKPEWVKLYGRTDPENAFFVRAKHFEQVTGTSQAGGRDVAWMYDSAGSDLFTGRPEGSEMRGLDANYVNKAESFEEVYAYAIYGGEDEARLYDSLQKDRLDAELPGADPGHWAQVGAAPSSTLDYLYYVRGFETAECWSSDPDDESYVDPLTADWLLTHDWS